MTTTPPRQPRLSADERRTSVVAAARRVFSRTSFHGATTAALAREAEVTEPILYRHFPSKCHLYLASLETVWSEVRDAWTAAVDAEPNPSCWLGAMGRTFLEMTSADSDIASLWVQALTEATDSPDIDAYMRRHVADVHAYVADVIERAQREGGILSERDARAEAWIFVSMSLLNVLRRRMGDVIECDMRGVIASRREWLTGSPA